MKVADSKKELQKGAVGISLVDKFPNLLTARRIQISRMQGYPVSVHTIGRIQRKIDLSDITSLMTSLLSLRDMIRVAINVIEAYEGIDAKKFTFTRTEVLLEVKNTAKSMGLSELPEDDLTLIGELILSYESNPDSWDLHGVDGEANLHMRFLELYQKLLTSSDHAEWPYFLATGEQIIKLGDAPAFKGSKRLSETQVASVATIHRLALTRMVDHVYQLQMDKNIWALFIPPRGEASLQSNKERAKGLRLFGLYIQSLLTYPIFFGLEMFLHAFDQIKGWLYAFGPLPDVVQHQLENDVRSKDLLGAKQDVQHLVTSLAPQPGDLLVKRPFVFIRELMGQYGFLKQYDELERKAASITLNADLKDLTVLRGPKFSGLLEGSAISSFAIMTNITNQIVGRDVIVETIKAAAASVIPAMQRFFSPEIADNLLGLGLKASLPFELPNAYSFDPSRSVANEVHQGKISLDSAVLPHSEDVNHYIRERVSFKLMTGKEIIRGYYSQGGFEGTKTDRSILDRDVAKRLVDTLSITGKTLVPATWGTGRRTWSPLDVSNSVSNVRNLLEELTGKSIELLRKQLFSDHFRQLLATQFSSFALLYIDPTKANDLFDQTGYPTYESEVAGVSFVPEQALLVQGFAKPYGLAYDELDLLQGPLAADDLGNSLIYMGSGVWLRFLKVIPSISTDLTYTDYYNGHFYCHCKANGGKISVSRWVIDDPMLNMVRFPAPTVARVPDSVMTDAFGYINGRVHLDLSTHHEQPSPTPGRESYAIVAHEHQWTSEILRTRLKFITFGPYAATTASALPPSEVADLTAIVKAGEAAMDAAAAERHDQITDEEGNAAASSVNEAL